MFIGTFFLVESPRWLVSRDRNAEALENLSYLRHLPTDHPYLAEEYNATEATIAHERGLAGAGFWGPIKTVFRSNLLIKRLLIGSSLFAWQNGTGINAINYYSFVAPLISVADFLHESFSPTIFRSIGVTGSSTALLTTGVYGISK